MANRKRIDPGPAWDYMKKATYSPAIACDGWLFISGLVATGPDRTILCREDIVGQTEIVLQRLGDVLRAAGCDYSDVVATREFVVTTENYKNTADLRRKYFPEPFPAATGIVVPRLLQPGALIEMEATARIPEAAQ
jgi:aminoacrylate peracid reductase